MFQHDTLAGKHALVCGASKGIGRACAQELARAGAKLTVLARHLDDLDLTLKSLSHQHLNHRAIACDLSDLDQVKSTLDKIAADVDILVCNSGGPRPGPLFEAELDEFDAAFRQHVLAQTLIVQALVPGMRERRYGRIINIISTSVKAPLPGLGVSNTIRGAVANWAKTLANELGPYGITVNNILPGFTKTQRLEQIVANKVAKSGLSTTEVETSLTQDVPMQRFAEPSEIGYACTFLASDLAAYINGVNLPVDGGRTLCLWEWHLSKVLKRNPTNRMATDACLRMMAWKRYETLLMANFLNLPVVNISIITGPVMVSFMVVCRIPR